MVAMISFFRLLPHLLRDLWLLLLEPPGALCRPKEATTRWRKVQAAQLLIVAVEHGIIPNKDVRLVIVDDLLRFR
jgi:hypothetical protein